MDLRSKSTSWRCQKYQYSWSKMRLLPQTTTLKLTWWLLPRAPPLTFLSPPSRSCRPPCPACMPFASFIPAPPSHTPAPNLAWHARRQPCSPHDLLHSALLLLTHELRHSVTLLSACPPQPCLPLPHNDRDTSRCCSSSLTLVCTGRRAISRGVHSVKIVCAPGKCGDVLGCESF
jgi:hypothetical protein